MNIIEMQPPSSIEIYKNLQSNLNILSEGLAEQILQEIIDHAAFQGRFTFNQFLKDINVGLKDPAAHIFQSDHYRNIIFKRAIKILYIEGYNCTLETDSSGRMKEVHYAAVVVHPVRKYLRMAAPILLPFVLGYGVHVASRYFETAEDRKQM